MNLRALFVGLALPVLAPAQSAAPRPNVVLIMADDMGWSDIGCYGGEIRTPNLDRLAAGGLRFTQFYNTGRCCPTRASLMTGLYPHQAGVGHMMGDRGFDGYRGDLNDRCVTIAEVLGASGYATWMAGKWHVTKQVGRWTGDETLTSTHDFPRQRGFDRFYGTITGAGSYFDPVSLLRDDEPIEPEGDDYYYTDAISKNAARFIDEHEGDEPFFLYVAFTSPHWPLHALDEDLERYRGRYDGGWDELREERFARQQELGLVDARWALTERDRRVAPWEQVESKAWQARRMEVYAAQVDRMDQGVGHIVAALERKGVVDDTLILFLADNGGCAEEIGRRWNGLFMPKATRDGRPVRKGNDPSVMPGGEDTFQSYGVPWANASNTPFRRYKHFVHEGGIATPLIAHWPARITRRGELESRPGHLVDVMATCVELAGAEYPEVVDGRAITPLEGESLVPALAGESSARGPIYFEHEGNRAVRDGKWKLVARGAKGPWELYDLEADRTETNDLAEARPELVRRLAASWERWAARAGVFPWPHDRRPLRERRPNLVLFIGDDHSIGDLGCYGNAVVRTPNLDRVAREGARFTRAFAPTAMCSPARSSLFTGLGPHRNGCHMNHGAVEPETRSLPHYLAALGYRIALAGKRHVEPQRAFPFEYLPNRLDFDAIEAFVTREDGPFCLVVASHEPHAPHRGGDYDPSDVPVPGYLVDTPQTRQYIADYYADVTRMDEQVGRTLAILDEHDLADRTMFVYAGDHGDGIFAKWTCYDAGLRVPFLVRWPGVVEPGSVRDALVSFIDVLPTFVDAAGGRSPGIDGRSFLPVLRGDAQEHRDAVFAAHTTNGIISGSVFPIRSVRTARFRYVRNLLPEGVFTNIITHGRRGDVAAASPVWKSWLARAAADASVAERVRLYQHRPAAELYDLDADPAELHNLAGDPAYADTLTDLSKRLDAWMKQQGDRGLAAERAVESRR